MPAPIKHSLTQRRLNELLSYSKTSGGYRGVQFRKRRGWFATIMVRRRHIYLGVANTAKKAAILYDVAAREHFGRFAAVNFKSRIAA